MTNLRSRPIRIILIGGMTLVATAVSSFGAQWPQWGGPNRNFTVHTSGLADSWPQGGPKRIWQRKLGDGCSTIVCDDGVLYTMYRKAWTSDTEYTIAVDRPTGKTIWEYENRTPRISSKEDDWGGEGPNSTPLVVGDYLYSIGLRGVIHCFDKKSGSVVWRRDLLTEFGARVPETGIGYSCSPIAYKNSIITSSGRDWTFDPVGPTGDTVTMRDTDTKRNGHTFIALEQKTGAVLWRTLDLPADCSSPILIRFAGRSQLVGHTRTGLVGVNPENGSLLWRHAWPRENAYTTPVWDENALVFYTTGAGDPGHVIRLLNRNGAITTEEVWSSPKMKSWVATPVRMGDYLVGGTGSNPGFLVAVHMQTGKVSSRERGYNGPSIVRSGDKLLILSQDGWLTLATLFSGSLTVHSKCKVAERYSFSVPTLVDNVLYVRDRKHMMAFDIGQANAGS